LASEEYVFDPALIHRFELIKNAGVSRRNLHAHYQAFLGKSRFLLIYFFPLNFATIKLSEPIELLHPAEECATMNDIFCRKDTTLTEEEKEVFSKHLTQQGLSHNIWDLFGEWVARSTSRVSFFYLKAHKDDELIGLGRQSISQAIGRGAISAHQQLRLFVLSQSDHIKSYQAILLPGTGNGRRRHEGHPDTFTE
jgi:hypothetical protein